MISTAIVQPLPAEPSQVRTEEIDASCAPAVLVLSISALTWLILASFLALISSVKLHAPGMLSGYGWITYGRLVPAQSTAFLYGFASQAALGITLWLLARLGRTLLCCSNNLIIAGVLWNLGVTAGVLHILAGGSTGFERLEMGLSAALILFFAYVLIAVTALVTFHQRTERTLYVSVWYLVAALFWLPWIFSTAVLLLFYLPLRGTVQPIVNLWFAHNLETLWLGPVALAIIFYLLPKVSNRPLYSYPLAVFSFWTYALFGTVGGFQMRSAFPSWLIGLSGVMTTLMIVPLIGNGFNWFSTIEGERYQLRSDISFRFIRASGFSYIIAGILAAALGSSALNYMLNYTLFVMGLETFTWYGFIALAILGAWKYMLPFLTRVEWPNTRAISLHCTLSIIGVELWAIPLLGGGIVQGNQMNLSTAPFENVIKATLPFIGMSTVGILIFLAAQVMLLWQVSALVANRCLLFCNPRDFFAPIVLASDKENPRSGRPRR